MNKPLRIRRKRKYKSPNPLFEKWLTEWKESAASKGLKTQFTFARALSSLKKYPLPLSSGKEAKVLEFFGDKICSMLDERLQQHKSNLTNSDTQVNCLSSSEKSDTASRKGDDLRASPSSSKCPEERTVPTVCSVILPHVNHLESILPQDVEECENSFCLQPGTFNVILCVDSIETASGHCKSKKQFLSELEKCGIPFEVRKLNVGDFLWIAKEKGLYSNPQHELVLDFVVERKRLDDLSHSIKDGRFREQKFRLRNCGARKPIFLIEYHSGHKYVGIPESTLEQAIVNTQVVDGFIVKRTRDLKESVAYLSSVSKHLQNTLQMYTLTSGSRQAVQNSDHTSKIFLTFEDFNHGAVKNKCLSVREMFAKHLLQFHGLSVDRAAALVERFQTPAKLFEVLQSCSSDAERIKVLSEIRYGKYQKSIGQALGRLLQNFYCTQGPLT